MSRLRRTLIVCVSAGILLVAGPSGCRYGYQAQLVAHHGTGSDGGTLGPGSVAGTGGASSGTAGAPGHGATAGQTAGAGSSAGQTASAGSAGTAGTMPLGGRSGSGVAGAGSGGTAGRSAAAAGSGVTVPPGFQSSLIHRYAFEGSGTTIKDLIGSADGTAIGCSLADGAITLDAAMMGDYVELPSGILSALSEVTVEAWVQWAGGQSQQRIFDFGNNNGDSGTSFFALMPSNREGAVASVANFTSSVADMANDKLFKDFTALSTSVVEHVAVTYDGSGFVLYRNGVSVSSFTDINLPLSAIDDTHNWLGHSQFISDPELAGSIYEFRVYSTALTASEIQASFNAGQNP